MPARWQASERPMFIRTVWVDGVRHAILNGDDPLLRRTPRRPLSSASHPAAEPPRALRRFSKSRLSHSGYQLEECFRKLQIVVDDPRIHPNSKRNVSTERRDSPVEKLDFGGIGSESEEELVLKASAQPLYEIDTSRPKYGSLGVEMGRVKTAKSAPSESPDKKYELSDRVFQWLDLAGKIDLLAPEPADARMARPRHSCPEIQKRIPHEYFAAKPPERREKIETPKFEETKVRREASIDPPGHAIESSARLPRPRPAPPRRAVKTNDGAPPAGADANYATRQQVVAEIYDVERQYAQLVGRAADGCGRHIKRQVHIFMPPLPKKSTSAATSRADSLLSHAS